MSHWQRFCTHFVRYEDPAISLDISRMNFPDDFLTKMEPLAEKAMKDMQALEAGAVANPDEKRMVGHYWLRQPVLAPTPEIRARIEADIVETQAFADAVHEGRLKTPAGEKFTDILVIGIGGSALGPQLVSDALTDVNAPMALHFFDNTDPDGMARVVRQIGDRLSTTLSVVISKSGGTPETRNGMLQARAAYEAKGLDFGKHAVAVTGVGSQLDKYAEANGFIRRFPMQDWVGGRTSVMHTVGMVPAALQGVDVAIFLAGAAAMDAETRKRPMRENLAMLLALMWHHAGGGRGAKDMVVLPYKDRLVLLSKYLQQLVMESIGKKHDLDGKEVHQGIAVYGNKGSTDQHAYVQQLRDGVNNFFATFIEVRSHNDGPGVEVEPGANSADFLQGFLRGTRRALFEQDRENVTISLEKLDTYSLGAVIALFERAVGFYASLVNINAYHQPGVEAGKKAAGEFLSMLAKVRAALAARSGPGTAEQIAADAGCDPEDAWHALNHLAATAGVKVQTGATPAADTFSAAG